MSRIDRFFSRLDGDAPGTSAGKMAAFGRILALVIGTEYWSKSIARWNLLDLEDIAWLILATVFAALVLHGRRRRAGFAGLTIVQLWYVWSLFPDTGNHRYLELFLCALLTMLSDRRDEDRRLFLRAARWAAVVVLLASGLQKLVHGYYFQGQFLSYALRWANFRTALAPFLPSGEVQRLVAYGTEADQGPYAVSDPLFLLISNGVWVAEVALGLLLFCRSTRRFAWPAAVVFLALTEMVARELFFGIELGAALLLFAHANLLGRLVKPAGLFMATLLLIRWLIQAGVLPALILH